MDDIEAIKQLTARYNRAFDLIDVPAYIATWTADGLFHRSNAERPYQGHDDLRVLLSTYPVRGRHVTSDYIISVDGDRAQQSCYLLYLDVNDAFKVVMFGTYADELVREDDGWKFAVRRLEVDLPD